MNTQKEIQLKIIGMSCQGCVNAVRSALENTSGVLECVVDLEKGLARVKVEEEKSNEAQLIKAVQEAGYDAELTA